MKYRRQKSAYRSYVCKNSRNHLVGFLTSSATHGIQTSFAFYARQ